MLSIAARGRRDSTGRTRDKQIAATSTGPRIHCRGQAGVSAGKRGISMEWIGGPTSCICTSVIVGRTDCTRVARSLQLQPQIRHQRKSTADRREKRTANRCCRHTSVLLKYYCLYVRVFSFFIFYMTSSTTCFVVVDFFSIT